MEKGRNEICIITQARMTSTRLPGKILKLAGNQTLLAHHIHRLKKTGYDLIIATTTNREDDPVETYAQSEGLKVFRGSEEDVLSRFEGASRLTEADIIVRVTSDCPLIDPHLIRDGIELYKKKQSDHCYVSNCFPRTYARGFDFEIFSKKMLLEAHAEASDIFEREHVTPRFWKNMDGKYDLLNLSQTKENGHLRITVDTPDDYTLIKKLIEDYHAEDLGYQEIEALLLDHPELIAMNAHVEQKKN